MLWQEAVHRQYERLRGLDSPDVYRDPDGALFVIALHNLVRAGRLCQRHAPELVDSIGRFEESLPDVKTMRDVIEHFDEYERGPGRRKLADTPLLVVAGEGSAQEVQLLNLATLNVRAAYEHGMRLAHEFAAAVLRIANG